MAKITDLMITVFFDEPVIEYINDRTGLDFLPITNSMNCDGVRIVAFEAFATCPRCIGEGKLNELIKVFKEAPFINPEYALLLISDDEIESFNGVYKLGEFN